MIEILLVLGDKCVGVASIKAGFEQDSWVTAGAEAVSALVLFGRSVESVACRFLRLALLLAASKGSAVGRVRTGVVLDRA